MTAPDEPTRPRTVVIRRGSVAAVDAGGGIARRTLVDRSRGATQLRVGMTEIGPRTAVPLHTHDSEECVLVLEGSGECELEGVRHPVAAEDCVWVGPDTPHRFLNTGAEPMRILWVYGDVDTRRTVIESGLASADLDPRA